MTEVYLDHPTFALGDMPRSVADSVRDGRTISGEAELCGAGFERHHICSARRSAYDLARAAVQGLASHLDGVGAIIYATCLPENASVGGRERFAQTRDVKHLMDFPVSHLQADFGLGDAVLVGLNQQACTGSLGAVRMARALVRAEPETRRVLCVTADRFPEGALYEQAYNLVSDGAAACMVSTEPRGFRLVACHGVANGALAQADDDETVGSFFSYTVRVIRETLAKTDLAIADIDWIVPQNTHAKAWSILARLLGCDAGRVWHPSLPEVGHMISGDNLVNLKSLVDAGRVEPGQKVLLFMAGYGLNWQCVILERARHG